MSVRAKKSPHQKAVEILANCKEKFDGCLIWQGSISETGYAVTTFNGRTVRAHPLVALYGVQRSEEQIEELKQYRIEWTCGHRICLRLDGGHMHFSTRKPDKSYEELPTLDEMLRNRGITWL